MASLKEIKTRIASVKNTLKITSAMKMVASAKLHKAQTAIGNNVPYSQQLHRILGGVLQDIDLELALKNDVVFCERVSALLQDFPGDHHFSVKQSHRVAVVAFSSNSSLCGSFNANVIRRFKELMTELAADGYPSDEVDVYAVGRKIAEAARKEKHGTVSDWSEMADRPDYGHASRLSDSLVESFISGKYDRIVLVYSHFASMGSQPVTVETYLPLPLEFEDSESVLPVDYILEPDPLALVRSLLPKILKLKVFTVMLDASAAEHAARTIAMQVASDNATNLIAELTLAYNKSRQQAITAEILDIVGGSMNA